jgi:hypothetical protein
MTHHHKKVIPQKDTHIPYSNSLVNPSKLNCPALASITLNEDIIDAVGVDRACTSPTPIHPFVLSSPHTHNGKSAHITTQHKMRKEKKIFIASPTKLKETKKRGMPQKQLDEIPNIPLSSPFPLSSPLLSSSPLLLYQRMKKNESMS